MLSTPLHLARVTMAATLLASAAAADAALALYTDRPTWLAETAGTLTLVTFDDFSPVANILGNDSAVVAAYGSLGLTLQPLTTTGIQPLIQQGSGAITTSGTYWFGNLPSIGFSEASNALRLAFSSPATPVRAFAFFDVGSDDAFAVRAYDANDTLIGSGNTQETPGTPLFWGFVADTDIARVTITPRTGNGYIGIDNFEFGRAVPEPSTWAMVALGLLGLAVGARRRRER
jgi:hypothetical protein